MGRGTNYPGVEQHGTTLRVSFTYEGERCRELTGWAPTKPNWIRASELRAEILREIRAGTFIYAKHFPDSKRGAAKSHLFSDVAQEWIDAQELADSTLDNYERILNTHWIPKLGTLSVRDITPGKLKRVVKDAGFKSDKTRNNCASVLRMVFDWAKEERYIASSPAEKLGHAKTQKAPPDPFTVPEMRLILAWLDKHAKAQTANYFRFAFFSGLRTSELLQLQWEKIDFPTRRVRVDEAFVLGKRKPTKTNEARDVELSSEGMQALLAQKAHTFLAFGHVFLNPNTGRPYYNQQAPWLAFRACLKALGLRHRPAYNTRHTYATMALMAGAKPTWISKQLGHRNVQITLTVYARWLEGEDRGCEVNKLDDFLVTNVQRLGQSLGQTGTNRGTDG